MRVARTDRPWSSRTLSPAMRTFGPCRPRWRHAVAQQYRGWSRSAFREAPGLPKRGSSTTNRPRCVALAHRRPLLTIIPKGIMIPFLGTWDLLERRSRLPLRGAAGTSDGLRLGRRRRGSNTPRGRHRVCLSVDRAVGLAGPYDRSALDVSALGSRRVSPCASCRAPTGCSWREGLMR